MHKDYLCYKLACNIFITHASLIVISRTILQQAYTGLYSTHKFRNKNLLTCFAECSQQITGRSDKRTIVTVTVNQFLR